MNLVPFCFWADPAVMAARKVYGFRSKYAKTHKTHFVCQMSFVCQSIGQVFRVLNMYNFVSTTIA